MKIKTRALITTLALATALLSPPAIAATGTVVGNVTRILITPDSSFGGCMANLSVSPQTVVPTCNNWWVSFSCTGDFADPVRAYRMLDQAQLALVTGKRVQVWFTDANKHNGYCFATRIDVIK